MAFVNISFKDFTLDQASKLDGVIEKVLFSGAGAMAQVIYDEVKLNTSGRLAHPQKLTGALDSAIYQVYSPEESPPGRKTYKVSWNHKKAPHGHLIEFGTVKSPAYPFLRPAVDKVPAAVEAGVANMERRFKAET